MIRAVRKLSGRHLRAKGDIARDARDWRAAESLYRSYLTLHPDDAAIWVQIGHVLREQACLTDAIEAYREGARLAPTDADPWLHLGHTLKIAGETKAATEAMQRCFVIYRGKEVHDEIVNLNGTVPELSIAQRDAGNFLLIDDLVKFLIHHSTLSGIQRVQVGLLRGLLWRSDVDYRVITSSTREGFTNTIFWEAPRSAVRDLIAYACSGNEMRRVDLDKYLAKLKQGSIALAFMAGDVVFIPGAFWIVERTGLTCAALKAQGVRIGVYVYDLIPLSHPEFCASELVEVFARAFCEILLFADFCFTISDYVGSVVKQFIAEHGLPAMPVESLLLAHELTIGNAPPAPDDQFLSRLSDKLMGARYAIYVSTIEGRKNHLYVVNVWRELLRRGVDMPHLIFVGRQGWRAEGVLSMLDGTNYLDGRVHILHDVSDAGLARLYRDCDFSLFTSFVEGWGLPVGESLIFGKPCVASNTTSIPEVGGAAVDYVDPFNLNDGIDVIKRIATDADYRRSRVDYIAKHFAPRSWEDVCERFLDLMSVMSVAPPRQDTAGYRLEEGTACDFRWPEFRLSDLDSLLRYPARIALGNDFYDSEPTGTSMRGRTGVISIPTSLREGDKAWVSLHLSTSEDVAQARYHIGPVAEYARPVASMQTFPVPKSSRQGGVGLARVSVGANGLLRVQIRVAASDVHVDEQGRESYVVVHALSYHQAIEDAHADRTISPFLVLHRFDELMESTQISACNAPDDELA